eukprot:Lithocolla_globosa_v1_NODE_1108_length_2864_cov_6.286935.p1 type:complete len:687 gc:universal NODE_1108_length_2864_cov_6.286935:594-2654(+)
MPSDMESAIIAQYDKLVLDFAAFLRTASVTGQAFKLGDIQAIMKEKQNMTSLALCDWPLEKLYSFIVKQDRYNFLCNQVNIEQEQKTFEKLNPDIKAVSAQRFSLCFKSSVIKNCIYSVMLYEHRQQTHAAVASYLESKIDASSRFFYLPSISFHYNQTKMQTKKMGYLNELAIYFMQVHCMSEAVTNLKALLEEVGTGEEMHVREWRMKLGAAYTGQRNLRAAAREYLAVLGMLEVEWPSGVNKHMAIQKQLKIQNAHWKRRGGGEAQEQGELVAALCAFQNVALQLGHAKDSELALLLGLNTAMGCAEPAPQLPTLLARMALNYAKRGNLKMSGEYLEYAREKTAFLPPSQELVIGHTMMEIHFLEGQWETLDTDHLELTKFALHLDMKDIEMSGHFMLESYLYLCGKWRDTVFSATAVYQKSLDRADVPGAILHGIQAMCSLIALSDVQDLTNWLARLTSLIDGWTASSDAKNLELIYYSGMALTMLVLEHEESALQHLDSALAEMQQVDALIAADLHLPVLLSCVYLIQLGFRVRADMQNMNYFRDKYLVVCFRTVVSVLQKLQIYQLAGPLRALANSGLLLLGIGNRKKVTNELNSALLTSAFQGDPQVQLMGLKGMCYAQLALISLPGTEKEKHLETARNIFSELGGEFHLFNLMTPKERQKKAKDNMVFKFESDSDEDI